MLMPLDEDDIVQKTFVSAFTQALADLGWTDGRKVRMDRRWGGVDVNRIRALATPLQQAPNRASSNGACALGSIRKTSPIAREDERAPLFFSA
jgi:hypothetical protein